MNVSIDSVRLVARWTWDVSANTETCAICRRAIDDCCPNCRIPGDDCPPRDGPLHAQLPPPLHRKMDRKRPRPGAVPYVPPLMGVSSLTMHRKRCCHKNAKLLLMFTEI